MKTKIGFFAIISIFFLTALVTPLRAAQQKTTICHYQPNNPNSFRTLEVPSNALRAHLSHGDILSKCSPTTLFFEDFNDGNADGWWLGYSQHTPFIDGNWRVEDVGFPQYGTLVQDNGADHFIALVENIQVSNQTVETKLNFKQVAGYGGITVWYVDDNHWVNVLIYPAGGLIRILEDGDTVAGTTYSYSSSNDTWYNLEVVANSTTGELDIYVDDVYVLTHTVSTTYRTGLSGVNSGNSGGYFDDFKITSN